MQLTSDLFAIAIAIYAARRLASIEFSFDPCNIYTAIVLGATQGRPKCALYSLDVPKCLHTPNCNDIPA